MEEVQARLRFPRGLGKPVGPPSVAPAVFPGTATSLFPAVEFSGQDDPEGSKTDLAAAAPEPLVVAEHPSAAELWAVGVNQEVVQAPREILRIRSSSDSAGALGTAEVVRGVDVDPGADSSVFLAALFAALVNQRNSNATSTSKKKIGVSKCIFSR